jgi:hypothetical protein
MEVNTCFDRLVIGLNSALLDCMEAHLMFREDNQDGGEDTDFDRWIHGQIFQSEYNAL